MNKIYQALVLLLGGLTILNAYATPTNLDVYKQVVIPYYNSGQYFSELTQAAQQAEQYNLPSIIIPYKSSSRKLIVTNSYDIINTGDQYSDLRDGYADKTFKLPDPYYYIP